ncbi:uncharacterized protein K452DRAFT_322093 [Aplosporella prunicola CBS 121167]|uniref:DUF1275 domain protein n=1 Tax=Aplosporella prunicola CBS 121167 TaxID=1176127 RepID=A0A6A6AYT5_9PEZI|nr:uncharacterized protein K452DRAFT_322093 [Aplosporella prunicola CBS 121167]KAF2136940.1 hypothetical protein K452DRAFT_322093 [Aplosporella prunicola CBS 121167]
MAPRDIETTLDDSPAADHLPYRTPRARVRVHLAAEVSPTHADLLLLVCSLISGLMDSTLYNAYNTFVSMQTGNTIFIALGASNQNNKPYGWARSLCSLGFFVIGSFFFSRLHKHLGPRRRKTLVSSFLLQTAFIVVAAALVQGGAINGSVPNPSFTQVHWNELAPIALLSFQAAAQIVTSRALAFAEIPTIVITSLLCDLFSDPALTAPVSQNVKRNRRAAAFTLTLVGAIAGGWISKATKGVQAALWLVAGLKLAITGAWACWPAK